MHWLGSNQNGTEVVKHLVETASIWNPLIRSDADALIHSIHSIHILRNILITHILSISGSDQDYTSIFAAASGDRVNLEPVYPRWCG